MTQRKLLFLHKAQIEIVIHKMKLSFPSAQFKKWMNISHSHTHTKYGKTTWNKSHYWMLNLKLNCFALPFTTVPLNKNCYSEFVLIFTTLLCCLFVCFISFAWDRMQPLKWAISCWMLFELFKWLKQSHAHAHTLPDVLCTLNINGNIAIILDRRFQLNGSFSSLNHRSSKMIK